MQVQATCIVKKVLGGSYLLVALSYMLVTSTKWPLLHFFIQYETKFINNSCFQCFNICSCQVYLDNLFKKLLVYLLCSCFSSVLEDFNNFIDGCTVLVITVLVISGPTNSLCICMTGDAARSTGPVLINETHIRKEYKYTLVRKLVSALSCKYIHILLMFLFSLPLPAATSSCSLC